MKKLLCYIGLHRYFHTPEGVLCSGCGEEFPEFPLLPLMGLQTIQKKSKCPCPSCQSTSSKPHTFDYNKKINEKKAVKELQTAINFIYLNCLAKDMEPKTRERMLVCMGRIALSLHNLGANE